jgi:uncharacterized membrane protein YkvA (DUF1232 family)
MSAKISGDNVEKSSSFKSAKSKASEYANDPDKLNDLLDKAQKKANSKKGPLSEVWDSLMACFRLLRAYATGKYRNIPWQSLILIIASVTYFVMPIDLIPDFILGFGYIDDASLLGWTLKSVKSDIDNFIEWETI